MSSPYPISAVKLLAAWETAIPAMRHLAAVEPDTADVAARELVHATGEDLFNLLHPFDYDHPTHGREAHVRLDNGEVEIWPIGDS